ncbi:MAG TPA: tryptophan--tRNA ligase, partial [Nevskia sp.]|nr:tryptophan--tRNA ligase [Nevskia sp.]
IYLLDPPDVVTRKIKRAVTDMDNSVRYAPREKPGVSNLFSIYSGTSGAAIPEAEAEFQGKGYGAFKAKVAEAVVECLKPIQARYAEIREDRTSLQRVLRDGAERAAQRADATLRRVHDVLGFIPE